jgi:hypothetical protein
MIFSPSKTVHVQSLTTMLPQCYGSPYIIFLLYHNAVPGVQEGFLHYVLYQIDHKTVPVLQYCSLHFVCTIPYNNVTITNILICNCYIVIFKLFLLTLFKIVMWKTNLHLYSHLIRGQVFLVNRCVTMQSMTVLWKSKHKFCIVS